MAQCLSHQSVTDPIDYGERGSKERDDFGQTHWLSKTSKVAAKHSCGLIKINTYHPPPPKKSHFKTKDILDEKDRRGGGSKILRLCQRGKDYVSWNGQY